MNQIDEIKKQLSEMNPNKHWGEDEFFYSWIYSILSETSEHYTFLKEQAYQSLALRIVEFDSLVKDLYQDWKKGEPFEPMWERINKERQSLLTELEKNDPS